jgi:four helix bundle protein
MFVTYETALDLIRNLRDVVDGVKRFDADLADQMRRAASSITLNLGEGGGCSGGRRRLHNEIAHGSAREVKACLDTSEAWGWCGETETVRRILDRLLGLLWGLTKGRAIKTRCGVPVRGSVPSRVPADDRASP